MHKRTGYADDTDGSRPARRRTITLAVAEFKVPDTTPGRADRTPAVDWTGHQYKSTRDLKGQDPDHVGRESDAARRLTR